MNRLLIACACAFVLAAAAAVRTADAPQIFRQTPTSTTSAAEPAVSHATDLVTEGQRVFRYDTFGDEQFWGGALRLHQAIAGARFGGVGTGVSPATALAVGLKVDADALPPSLIQAIQRGAVDLNDPAN